MFDANLNNDDRFLSLVLDLESARSGSHVVDSHENDLDWAKFRFTVNQLKNGYSDLRLELLELEVLLEIDGATGFFSKLPSVCEIVVNSNNVLEEELDEIAPMVCSMASTAMKSRIEKAKLLKSASVSVSDILSGKGRHLSSFESDIKEQLIQTGAFYGGTLQEHYIKIKKDYLTLIEWFSSRASDMPFHPGPVDELLQNVVKNLGVEPPEAHEAEYAMGSQNTSETRSSSESILRRTDVVRSIDRIVEYFEFYEPGHPCPLLLKRARNLVGMSFEEIVNDMFPEAQGSLDKLRGQPHENF